MRERPETRQLTKARALSDEASVILVAYDENIGRRAAYAAVEAQAILTSAVATEWEELPTPLHPETNKPFMRRAVKGKTTKPWIEMVDNPGVKGKTRAKAKVDNDYGGDASQLKDLARLTLRFTSPAKLAQALRGLEKGLGFRIVVLKNKCALASALAALPHAIHHLVCRSMLPLAAFPVALPDSSHQPAHCDSNSSLAIAFPKG